MQSTSIFCLERDRKDFQYKVSVFTVHCGSFLGSERFIAL